MKAITIREPYASLVMLGEKRIETRSWAAPSWLIGQRIAIHAAKGLTLPELEMLAEPDFLDAFEGKETLIFDPIVPDKPARVADAFPHTRGKVIATAILPRSSDSPLSVSGRSPPANFRSEISPWVVTDGTSLV